MENRNPNESRPPLGWLSMSSIVDLAASKAVAGSASLKSIMIRSCMPSTGRYGISVKKKMIAGKIARKKSNEIALALDLRSPFCKPRMKNLDISSKLILILPGKWILSRVFITGSVNFPHHDFRLSKYLPVDANMLAVYGFQTQIQGNGGMG